MSRPLRVGALAAVAALGWASVEASCAHHPPAVRPYAAPAIETLLAAWRAHQTAVVAMNARARATSWVGGDRIRATVSMLVERTGKLRFEAEVSLQGTVAILATDGHRFGLLDVAHGELRRGPACPANVAALLRIPLAPPDVAAILLGDVRLPALGSSASELGAQASWDGEWGAEVVSITRAEGGLRVWMQRGGAGGGSGDGLEAGDWRVIGATARAPDGRTIWRLRYTDFTTVTVPSAVPGGASRKLALAQLVRFAERDTAFDDGVEIKFKQRSFNEPALPAAFALEPTPGLTTVEVGCP